MCQAIPSVTENLQKYSKRQIAQASRARTTYRTLGSLMVENFKTILRQNLIRNCPVTVWDVEIAEDLFGPDIATLKGWTTRQCPLVVINNQADLPEELQTKWDDLILCINNMHVPVSYTHLTLPTIA